MTGFDSSNSNLISKLDSKSNPRLDPNSNSEEIGLAFSHYHSKIGPKFIKIMFDYSKFDSLTQYNILQDSISTHSERVLFSQKDKKGLKYRFYTRKIRIFDSKARGGVQKLSLVLIFPESVSMWSYNLDEITEKIKESLLISKNIEKILLKWYNFFNKTPEKDKNDKKFIMC
ncbi:MAG: hypothetical protein GY870_18730 [archaeon]|nr:hypothetical protein [archaeon]